MQLDTRFIEASDGVKLFVRNYAPEQTEPTRTLYWVHGVGEHGGRHAHVAETLAQRGWRMVVADLRGHGQSGGIRTHVLSFDEYISDLARIWDVMGLNEVPPVLLGHSMGGLVAVRAVQSGRVTASALILSSPLLGLKLHVDPLKLMLGRLLVQFVPWARFSNGIDPANMTRDSEFAATRRSDALIIKTVTAGWFFAMQAALKAGRSDAGKVKLPVFALQGSLDRTTDPDAMADWWERIQSTEKSLVVLDDHVHELFFESDWQETTIRMLDWLDQKLVAHKHVDLKEQR